MQPLQGDPPSCPSRAGRVLAVLVPYRVPACASSGQPLRLLAQAGQLGPGGVEVTLGAPGPAAQLAARLLECLGAEFQRGPHLAPLAGRVGAQLLELAGRVLTGPRGLRAGGVGTSLCGGCALVSLRGLRERPVPVLSGLANPLAAGTKIIFL